MQQIGVFGACFNPPTLGHWNVLEQASHAFDKILLVPSLSHPFQKFSISIAHRLMMLSLMVESWNAATGKNNVLIDNIEAIIQNKNNPNAPIYTFDVLTALTDKYQKQGIECAFKFIIGPDNYKKEVWQKFYRYQDIEKNWGVFVVEEQLSIHSTYVREIIATHLGDELSLKQKLETFLEPKIIDYILHYQLYRSTI
jgi:nicotinate-nucleotide adenylyltransferase